MSSCRCAALLLLPGPAKQKYPEPPLPSVTNRQVKLTYRTITQNVQNISLNERLCRCVALRCVMFRNIFSRH
uniref:Putative secreted protein n=1 Tax=Anopheles darlingi TaxID=43151 RepID=A0A2M4DC74_ANODA